jgi:hypothetical protein
MIIRNLIFKEMSLLHEYQPNAIKIKVTNYFIFLIKKINKQINEGEIEKIAYYTRFTRHVVELLLTTLVVL